MKTRREGIFQANWMLGEQLWSQENHVYCSFSGPIRGSWTEDKDSGWAVPDSSHGVCSECCKLHESSSIEKSVCIGYETQGPVAQVSVTSVGTGGLEAASSNME